MFALQSCGRTFSSSGIPYDIVDNTDPDQDGIPNMQDNCPDIYNPNQADSNSDGQGDACTHTNQINSPLLSMISQDDITKIVLAWTNTNANVTEFILKRKINDGDYTVLAQLNANQFSYEDSSIQMGTSYTYKVEVHANSQLRTSNFISLSLDANGAIEILPSVPSNISIDFLEVNGACRARFNWYDNSDNETMFFLFGNVVIFTTYITLNDPISIEHHVNAQETSSTGLRQHIMMGEYPILPGYDNQISVKIMACDSEHCSDFSPEFTLNNGAC